VDVGVSFVLRKGEVAEGLSEIQPLKAQKMSGAICKNPQSHGIHTGIGRGSLGVELGADPRSGQKSNPASGG
jgi:hypothetical protein